MSIKELLDKIKSIISLENKDFPILISTKNSTIINQENNFKYADRIQKIEISDIQLENNIFTIKHKENIVALSRDNEYIFLKWRCNEYEKIRNNILQLLLDDSFSSIQKDKIKKALIEDKFIYNQYVNLEHNK